MRLLLSVFAFFLCAIPMKAEEPLAPQVVESYELWRSGNAKAAIALLEPLVQPGSKITAQKSRGMAWSVLSSSYLDMERFAEARRACEHALELLQPLPDARTEFAGALDNLGILEQSLGRTEEAKSYCSKSQRIYETLRNPEGIAITATNLAVIAYVQNDFKAARRSLAKAIDAAQQTTELREDDLAALDTVRSAVALHDHRNDEAMAAIQQAIERWTRTYGPDYFMLVNGYILRGQVFASSGDHVHAMIDANHGLARAQALWGKDSVGYLNAENGYSRVLRLCGQKDEARRLASESSQALAVMEQRQCAGCTVNASGFR